MSVAPTVIYHILKQTIISGQGELHLDIVLKRISERFHVELAKELSDRGHNVLLVDYQPTSEMMVIDFAEKIQKFLPENIQLHSLKLQETDSSFAEWYASDNK